MKKIDRIMVVVDANEDYSNAPDGLPIELRKALRFIQKNQSVEIKLISVGYEKYLHHSFVDLVTDYTVMRKEYCDRLSVSMQGMVEKLSEQGYKISSEVAWAHPRYEEIVRQAVEFKADLLVQHCRGVGHIENYHLTHDSWELVRHCPVPLLLVKDEEWGSPVVMMAAVDPMHSHNKPTFLDKKILESASTVAKQLGGVLHVVHAYAEAARPFAPAGKIKEEHSKAFAELMADYDFDASQQHLIDETPVYAVQQYGKEIHSNIAVMGAVSRSRWSEALIGSTAEKVLDYIKTDILLLKPTAD
jgi:universal stress protein E